MKKLLSVGLLIIIFSIITEQYISFHLNQIVDVKYTCPVNIPIQHNEDLIDYNEFTAIPDVDQNLNNLQLSQIITSHFNNYDKEHSYRIWQPPKFVN